MANITVNHKGKTLTETTNSYTADVNRADVSTEDLKKFYKGSGWLSNYAYMCGYMESAEDYTLQAEGGWAVKGNGVWENFELYADARRYFTKLVKASMKKRIETEQN